MSLHAHHHAMLVSAPSEEGSATEGLVCHFPLDSASFSTGKFASTVGTRLMTYTDSTSGGPVFVTGPISEGVDYTGRGSNCRIWVGSATGIQEITFDPALDDYSTAMWFKGTNPDALVASARFMENSPSTGTPYYYDTVMYLSKDVDRIRGFAYDGTTQSAVEHLTSDAYDNDWHLVTFVMDNTNGEARLYLDDTLIDTGPTLCTVSGLHNDNTRITLGNRPAGDRRITGAIADFRRFDRAITLADVKAIWASRISKTGLLFTYSFDDVDKVWTDTDSEIKDTSGNNRHGNAVGMTSGGSSTGVIGQGQSVNVTTYVLVANDAAFNTNAFSIAIWHRTPSSLNSDLQAIIGRSLAFDNRQFQVYYRGDQSNQYQVKCSGAGASEELNADSAPTAANTWYHIVITADGSTVRMYIDNVLQAETLTYTQMAYPETDIVINATSTTGGSGALGVIDGAYFYNRVISDSERTALYNAGNP